MKSSTLLALIRRMADIWIDLEIEGWYDDAGKCFTIMEDWFMDFRMLLVNERRALEELPPLERL